VRITAIRLRIFRTRFRAIVPEAGRAEAGIWKEFMQISTIPAQRAGLQGCPHSFVFSLT